MFDYSTWANAAVCRTALSIQVVVLLTLTQVERGHGPIEHRRRVCHLVEQVIARVYFAHIFAHSTRLSAVSCRVRGVAVKQVFSEQKSVSGQLVRLLDDQLAAVQFDLHHFGILLVYALPLLSLCE